MTMISPVDDHGAERCTVMIMGAKSAAEMQAENRSATYISKDNYDISSR